MKISNPPMVVSLPDSRRYKIVFKHLKQPKYMGDNLDGSVYREDYVGTECTIFDYSTTPPTPLETAVCKLHYKDKFVKELGRKASLVKLFKNTDRFTKEERALFWEAYLNRNV